METLIKIFLTAFLLLSVFFITLYFVVKKLRNSMKFSLISLIKFRQFEFLDEDKIKEILHHFKNVKRDINLINKLKGKPVRSLYSVVRRTLSLALENKEVYCLVSQETTKKMMKFVYEETLKPHIFSKWWFTEKDEVDLSIDSKSLTIQGYLFIRTEFLENNFQNLISNQFLQKYSQKAINKLDTSSEDKLINKFFSEEKDWPTWLKGNNKLKLTEFPSGKIKVNVRDIFWLVPDNIANRIRYKLWKGFAVYLLNYFNLESSDIRKWNNIKKVRVIYDLPQKCYELPRSIKPVIEEILLVSQAKRTARYQRFLLENERTV